MTKKTAIIYITNVGYVHNQDEWDSFRAEGRIPINIGFGLSLLGYNVNIVCSNWSAPSKKTWNNIELSNSPLHNNYDIALTLSSLQPLYYTKFNTGISIVYNEGEIVNTEKFIETTNIQLKYAYMNKLTTDSMKIRIKETIYYLPPLYPIPSINIGFVLCSYKPELPILRVFLVYTSWSQNTVISGDRFTGKEQIILDYLKSKGYDIKLSVLVENKEASKQCSLVFNNIKFFYSNECSYQDIIKLIQINDICITNGGPVFPGNCLIDMISLGKPIIYIGDGRPNVEWKGPLINYLYTLPDSIIHIQESYHESIQKLDRIISNPHELCEKYQNVYRDFDFNNWKYIVKDIFDVDKKYLEPPKSKDSTC